jgi:hypothetical protein
VAGGDHIGGGAAGNDAAIGGGDGATYAGGVGGYDGDAGVVACGSRREKSCVKSLDVGAGAGAGAGGGTYGSAGGITSSNRGDAGDIGGDGGAFANGGGTGVGAVGGVGRFPKTLVKLSPCSTGFCAAGTAGGGDGAGGGEAVGAFGGVTPWKSRVKSLGSFAGAAGACCSAGFAAPNISVNDAPACFAGAAGGAGGGEAAGRAIASITTVAASVDTTFCSIHDGRSVNVAK